MRILFFGDGAWAANSLRRLVGEGHTLLGVVVRTNSTDSTLIDVARDLQLPVFRPDKVNDAAFLNVVSDLRPDLSLSISYDQILRRPIIEAAPLGFVNFHAGRLPFYRGRSVINWAIINGETDISLTAHYVDLGIDTGDIILQHSLPVAWTDTYGDVMEKAVSGFPDLMVEAVRLIESGKVNAQPQGDHAGTYFSGRGAGDEDLDWSDTSYNLHNKIRAITRPGPGARSYLDQRPVVIWKAFYDTDWPKYIATPGQVVGRCLGQGVVVKTGDSTILVQEAQVEDALPAVPWWKIGTRLGPSDQIHLQSLQSEIEMLKQEVDRLKQAAR